jgi:hypothetical protein
MALPAGLQEIMIRYLMNSEDSKDSTVEVEWSGLNSLLLRGVRNASKELRFLFEEACRRWADRTARRSSKRHANSGNRRYLRAYVSLLVEVSGADQGTDVT